MKKKTISLLMAASLAASSLACGIVSFAEESDPITLSVWAPFTGSDGDVLREIIDNYNETNTDNITVQIDIMDNATLQSKLPTAVSTGTGPSFVLVGIEFLFRPSLSFINCFSTYLCDFLMFIHKSCLVFSQLVDILFFLSLQRRRCDPLLQIFLPSEKQ